MLKGMLKTSLPDEKRLPLVVGADHICEQGSGRESMIHLCLDYRDFLHDQLLESGTLLFRAFPVLTADHIRDVMRKRDGARRVAGE
ncbi:MAG TPA: hypothetical protein VGX92_18845 [Pyrinomonadaceae bacterium]|nr:hypothetical protein [Pyrinomonadaceae bacterium]